MNFYQEEVQANYETILNEGDSFIDQVTKLCPMYNEFSFL